MASADVVERVRTVASRIAETYGLEIFDVQFRREASGLVLRVRIDRPGPAATAGESVSVDDCANVSRDLSAVLDVEDVVPAAYTLEVSSPGLDRPLRGAEDYRRFTGRRAKIVMREAIDGQTYFKGRLAGVVEKVVKNVVENSAERDTVWGEAVERVAILLIDGEDGRQHRVPIGIITRANLEVEF
jgi:ribosome maturation factor RimP